MQQSVERCLFLGLSLFLAVYMVASASAKELAEPLVLEGQLTQGALLTGKVSPGASVAYVSGEGKLNPLTVSVSGTFALGLGRDADQALHIQVTEQGKTYDYHYEITPRDYQIQRIEGVQQKHVTPPKEVLERIRKESAQVREARTLNDAREDFLGPFQWPLKGRVTGVYGSQRVYNGVPKSPHYGIDIAAPDGTDVAAPADGVVSFADNDLYYSGGTLIIDHGHGVSSTFIHLSRIDVKVGQAVKQGDTIAGVGSTGRSTGPHLDWRMNWFDQRIDPQLLFPAGSTPASP